jgi:hypothetical protein
MKWLAAPTWQSLRMHSNPIKVRGRPHTEKASYPRHGQLIVSQETSCERPHFGLHISTEIESNHRR